MPGLGGSSEFPQSPPGAVPDDCANIAPVLSVAAPRFEYRAEALGIGTPLPRLSWMVDADTPDWVQSAYEIEMTDSKSATTTSSGRIESRDSAFVPWPFGPLASRDRRAVRVRVWDQHDQRSDWSTAATAEVGLLAPADWTARFIAADLVEEQAPGPSPHLRRDFEITKPIATARLYVTALGLYEVELNGARVGDHVLAPGWSTYNHRLRYETFDVAAQLHTGRNAIGAVLADGWYRGRIGFAGGRRSIYGDTLALLAQLEVTFDDGSTMTVATDDSWRAAHGPTLMSGIYEGESYDARRELDGWSTGGYDDTAWASTSGLEADLRTLVARSGPPVRRTERIRPVAITTAPSGKTLIDFGQNLVGRLEIRVAGSAGTTITLRHAEVLLDGELCTTVLRAAAATDTYVLRGNGTETWEPRFTFHGFRYADVEGWPGELTAGDVTAVVCHSDMERTGWFECSDSRVTQLHENIVWGMRGNFLDVPTDCPQRDERLGWTGDIHVFAPTACFLFDCDGFLASWLADLALDQGADGAVPFVVPHVLETLLATAVWGDAAVGVPWALYGRFGDGGILRTQYPSMRAWIEHIVGLAGDDRIWDKWFQFGDWLDPAAPEDKPADGRTDGSLVANAYLCHSLDIMASTADLLGEKDDALRYAQIAGEARAAFAHEYVAPSGRVSSDSQTGYALALQFDLLADDKQRMHAGERLATSVRRAGHKIATGFVGTPIVCDALCSAGYASTAYQLLLQEDCPSWLYPVLHGATTIWERWDGILPDGRINGDGMNSFNHYALGAVGDWLHRTVAGLSSAEPGYRRLRIAPLPGGGLTSASARHRTPYGLAEVTWRIERSTIHISATVPPNTSATVVLPDGRGTTIEVGSGTHEWTSPYVVQEQTR